MSVFGRTTRVLVAFVGLAWSLFVISALVALTYATLRDVIDRRRE